MIIDNTDYIKWISSLKVKFKQAQLKAATKVNSTLLNFYWELGEEIVSKQKDTTWGSNFIPQLSRDLQKEFPDIKGFSERNIKYMRQLILFYIPKSSKGQQLVAQNTKQLVSQIPWGQNIVILTKCKNLDEALFYVSETIENGWSRAVLTHQIESNLWKRQGKAITNFTERMPKVDSDLANQIIKDPYDFEFLTLTKDFKEKELEKGLVTHITQFLLELGSGFAFVGKQVPLTVGNKDFYIDLLFYHIKLRCYVVIELKAVDFEPEFAGKLNFYLNVVDGELKHKDDNPTIGMLLCKGKDKMVVEYALKNIDSPIGVSEYQITESLPKEFQSALPTVEQIEAEFGMGGDE